MSALLLASGLLDDLGLNFKVLGTQVVIFVTTFLVLSRLLFGRVLDFMKKREEEIKYSMEAIERDRKDVERMTAEYQASLAKIDREAYDKMQAIFREMLATSAAVVAKAQTEAQREVEQAGTAIKREKDAASTQLRTEVKKLAQGVAEKVLETKLA